MVCLSGLGRCRIVLLAVLDDDGKDGKGGNRESEKVPGIGTLSREHKNWVTTFGKSEISYNAPLPPTTHNHPCRQSLSH